MLDDPKNSCIIINKDIMYSRTNGGELWIRYNQLS